MPLLGLLVIPILPVCAGAGAAVGAAASQNDDVPPGYSNEALAEAEASAHANLDTGALQARILERAQFHAQENVSYQLVPVQSAGTGSRPEWPSYAVLSEQGFDTALEVEFIKISLEGSLQMEARARLVSLTDGDVLSSAQYGYASPDRTLESWMADGAAPLVGAIEEGLDSLAEDIVDGAFLLYHPSTPAPVTRWGPVPYYVLAPKYPTVEYSSKPFGDADTSFPNLEPAAVATMPLTFRWERFPRGWDSVGPDGKYRAITNIRYELRVYDDVGGRGRPREVYRVRDLLRPEHRIAFGLGPCAEYFWTVRARFELDGLTRVTEWAGAYRAALGPEQKPWNLRRDATGPKPSWFYFPFITPGEDGECSLLKEEKYLQAREEEIRLILLSALASGSAEMATASSVVQVKGDNVDCDAAAEPDAYVRAIAVFPPRGWVFGRAAERNQEVELELERKGNLAVLSNGGLANHGWYAAGKLDGVVEGASQLTGNVQYMRWIHREYALLFAEKIHLDAVMTYWYEQRGSAAAASYNVEVVLIDAKTGDIYQSTGSLAKVETMSASVLCSYVATASRSAASKHSLASYSPAQRERELQRLPTPSDKIVAIKVLCDDGLLSYEDYDKRRKAHLARGFESPVGDCYRKP